MPAQQIKPDISDFAAFLKQDCYWPRRLRIAHARINLNNAKTPYEKEFWSRVLTANKD